MPRKPVIRSNENFYHLTARSNNKEHFYLDTDEVWGIIVNRLHLLQIEHDLKILSLVVMSNHFHLLMLTPKSPINVIMFYLMKDVTKDIQKRTGRINKIFGGRYKGCVILEQRYLMNAYKYVSRNPVAAGICARVEDYEYSTHFKDIGETIFPLKVDSLADSGMKPEMLGKWLNESYSLEDGERIRWGLSRTEFTMRIKQ